MNVSIHTGDVKGINPWVFAPTDSGCICIEIRSPSMPSIGTYGIWLHGTPEQIREFCQKIMAALPEPPTTAGVMNHKDGDPANNEISNLELRSQSWQPCLTCLGSGFTKPGRPCASCDGQGQVVVHDDAVPPDAVSE